jgi:hypothetical protein
MVNEQANHETIMPQPRPTYHSYLIRFWRMDNAGQPVWRVGVEEPGTQMPIYFENLTALFVFLAEQLGVATEAQKPAAEQDAAPTVPLPKE